jgi:hypothetical protein
VPGGVAGAATEFTLVDDVDVSRITATGDLLFFKGTSGTACQDFSTFPTPPFPFIITETGVEYWWHREIFRSDWNLHKQGQRSGVNP